MQKLCHFTISSLGTQIILWQLNLYKLNLTTWFYNNQLKCQSAKYIMEYLTLNTLSINEKSRKIPIYGQCSVLFHMFLAYMKFSFIFSISFGNLYIRNFLLYFYLFGDMLCDAQSLLQFLYSEDTPNRPYVKCTAGIKLRWAECKTTPHDLSRLVFSIYEKINRGQTR